MRWQIFPGLFLGLFSLAGISAYAGSCPSNDVVQSYLKQYSAQGLKYHNGATVRPLQWQGKTWSLASTGYCASNQLKSFFYAYSGHAANTGTADVTCVYTSQSMTKCPSWGQGPQAANYSFKQDSVVFNMLKKQGKWVTLNGVTYCGSNYYSGVMPNKPTQCSW